MSAVSTRRGTLCLTVDNLGMALAVGRQRAAHPDPDEPGLRWGVPAFLELFAELRLRSTFFVEGWNALHHPDVIERIASAGHEIGLHGWVHERWAEELDDRAREQLLWDGTAALRLAGFDPVAFRAPGGYRGSCTLEVLSDLGYRIDSSIDAKSGAPGTTPAITSLSSGLVCIPWTWDMIDFWQYEMRPDGPRTPGQVAEDWMELTEAAADRGGLVTLIIHPFVTGVDPERMAAMRRVLENAIEHPGIDVLSAGQVAEAHLSQLPGAAVDMERRAASSGFAPH
ncbi:polysaccharide deacetylase family protein [Streptomyces sp. NPDC002896]|uniref:polysaccharide deacetylase family protein n=1 Tax=Streptomyces sp. NPDC002896 TaxID=3154438 RepID=UPI00332D5123